MGRRRALLVGINYPGTEKELLGCVNDVARMRRCLVDRFGFDETDIRVLTDGGDQYSSATPPTGANIRLELQRLVEGAAPGDALFFHYSGHGLRLQAETGQEDDTGYDECIVPCDGSPIDDQELMEFVQKVPDGCLFTIVSDSCHSGGLIDRAKEQIGNSTKQNRDRQALPPSAAGTNLYTSIAKIVRGALEYIGIHRRPGQHASVTSRSLPLSTFIRMLREKTGKDDVDVGSIRMTLFNHFGEDATPKIKKFARAMASRAGGGAGKAELDGDGEVHSVEEVYAGAPATVPRNGVLISGCQSDQTSADLTTAQGVSYGALSDAVQTVLTEKKHGKVTNRELVLRARELLAKHGYPQQPGLYCSDEHANVPFIC